MSDENDWRNDPGLSHSVVYKKRFALFPVTCNDGVTVWFRHYYTKYKLWGYKDLSSEHVHTDRCESITEAEYIVRKLIEGF